MIGRDDLCCTCLGGGMFRVRGCTGDVLLPLQEGVKFLWNFMGTKVQILKKSPGRVHIFSSAAVHQSYIQGKPQKFCYFISANACEAWAAESSQDRTGGAEVLSITSAACPAMPPEPNNPPSRQTWPWRKQNQPL